MSDARTGTADIGVVGLAVMGANIARNLARKGYKVAVYNRSYSRTEKLVDEHGDEGTFIPSEDIADFVASLSRPRVAMILVQAGAGTDAVIEQLAEYMEEGDIIVDCGNAYFKDTIRRERDIQARGLHFVGAGVSGGEEGALEGPSIMPGGTPESYKRLGPMLEEISAHVDGEPCCTYISNDGAGHFVKMVHNGIEYADMQLIAEAYDLLRRGLGDSPAQIADIFESWMDTELNSYLIEITAEVLRQVDAVTGKALVDIVVDAASQKGTGAWTVQTALELGVPVTGIGEATFARGLSSSPVQRGASGPLEGHEQPIKVVDREGFIEQVRQALYASKIVAYSQGFDLIQAGNDEYGWDIKKGDLAKIWRAGCIIRAVFLGDITEAYENNPDLPLLMADEKFASKINACVPAWREIVGLGVASGIPIPAFSSSLSYFDGVRADRLPAALIQGQRDFFGSHTYKRIDMEGTFHTEWSGDRSETRWS
ncbi:NADP-dependent phosphogluconate dehydrogenase [Flaviflexus massiliensis]|uniref:NADP-dependent phosphogluconate dehydrogenase n=1 Tax=Flaviflexus massiliensis TaxID=1522309 RepID=UPI0006D5A4D9|nr:NADP-dependent phosphogluconate dehydrogenase [Flaviflexus massiliensis]